MFEFDALARLMPQVTVLCIGDVMLDEFVYGEVSRISPEAPAPVLAVRRTDTNIGGAGNVACNVAGLGARCILIGLVGADLYGEALRAKFAEATRVEAVLLADAGRPTTRKVRYVSEHFSTHLLRADWENAQPASAQAQDDLIDAIGAAMPRADIVVLSDYAKGVLTPRVVEAAVAAARRHGVRLVVDPKSVDFSLYRGASVVTPNKREFVAAAREAASGASGFARAAESVMDQVDCEAVLVTESEDGMTLMTRGAPPLHVAAHQVKVRDVSGAGDTVAAALAVALAAGADWEAGIRIANAAAAAAVSKSGTAAITLAELRRIIVPESYRASEEKVARDTADLDARLALWRAEGRRIGFTNGCFDILHPGHIKVLTAARAACDRLIVGLNSDASVKRLKGASRPLQKELARAEVLAALEAVDCVVIFGEDTPLDLIARVQPRVLVKGGDYTREQVVGHDIVEALGGEVLLVDVMPGFSTTSLVKRAGNAVA
jgi:D-beta-D-heptose 7-phosphate kinase/D-beta-D-heptose 1-phosphate adenosyltransferase